VKCEFCNKLFKNETVLQHHNIFCNVHKEEKIKVTSVQTKKFPLVLVVRFMGKQSCGYRSGSSILSEYGYGYVSGSRLLMTKNGRKKIQI
jgi:hypothetical protein